MTDRSEMNSQERVDWPVEEREGNLDLVQQSVRR